VSFGNPQADAASASARENARFQKELSDQMFPALRRLLATTYGDINIDKQGNLGIPDSIVKQFGVAQTGVNRDFDVAERGANAYTSQSFKQSGNPYSPGQLDAVQRQQLQTLEQGRSRAMGQLKFEEAQAGLGQFNQLMNLMSGGVGSALNLGAGYGAAQNATLRFLPTTTQEGAGFSGAIAGAGAGASFGPYGALAGALIGGVGGALSYGG